MQNPYGQRQISVLEDNTPAMQNPYGHQKHPNSCNRSSYLKQHPCNAKHLRSGKNLQTWSNALAMQNPYGHIPSKNVVVETTPLKCKIPMATWPLKILVLETAHLQCKIPTATWQPNTVVLETAPSHWKKNPRAPKDLSTGSNTFNCKIPVDWTQPCNAKSLRPQ